MFKITKIFKNDKGLLLIKELLCLILIFYVLLIPVSADIGWYDSSWSYRIDSVISSSEFPYQMNLTIHSGSGTNNATDVFLNGHNNTNFTDIIFTLDNTTELSYWIEDNTTDPVKVWINVTTNGTVNLYYGNPSASDSSSGDDTFQFFDNFDRTTLNPTSQYGSGMASETASKSEISSSGLRVSEYNVAKYTAEPLWTYNNSQYAVFTDNNYNIIAANRTLPGGEWYTSDTGVNVASGDAHRTTSLGVDPNGYIHIAYGHHNDILKYIKSDNPENITSFSGASMTGSDETEVSYPTFFSDGSNLFFAYSDGLHAEGRQTFLNKLNHTSSAWSALHHPFIGDGAPVPYVDSIVRDSFGHLHVSWMWRTTTDPLTNHKVLYAKSEDNGTTWKRTNGSIYSIPISETTAEEADSSGTSTGLLNSNDIAVDSSGNPHIVYIKKGSEGYLNYFHTWHNGTAWNIQQITNFSDYTEIYNYCQRDFSRPAIIMNGTTAIMMFRIPVNGSLYAAVASSPYTDWEFHKIGEDTWGYMEVNFDRERWLNSAVLDIFASNVDGGAGSIPVDVLNTNISNWNYGNVLDDFYTSGETKWTEHYLEGSAGGSVSVADSEVTITQTSQAGTTSYQIYGNDIFLGNTSLRLKGRFPDYSDTPGTKMGGWIGFMENSSFGQNEITISMYEAGSSVFKGYVTINTGTQTPLSVTYDPAIDHIYDSNWLSSSSVKFYHDDNYDNESTTNIPTTSLPVSAVARTWTGGNTVRNIIDWIFVHKCIEIPLTWGTWSTESEIPLGPTIIKFSFYPTPLNTNYTGATTISYMVESTNPLNLSSLAFLYGLNYTTTGDMHNYVATPPIDIASEGIYLGPNRNATPYLSWEFNTTITNNNVWQWGGGDNNSWWIEKNQINATHTYINATGVTQHILPSSFYIQKLAMYNAPKTGFEINRQQGLIFKMWNVEEIRNRGHNYFANLYFDTSWESTLPNYPVEVGFCNYSYDPAVDDIDTCPDCTKFGEWDGNRWVNHSWVPGPNASYAYPLVVNGSQYTEPTPTDINYIWLRSNTISSKSFVLNATNYDPGITNISFAETNTMWTYNELNGVTSPVAYTPSFFTTFVRNDEELLHHLYIADDTGAWGHSDIFSESIGISSVSVPPVSFEYFNVTCDESYHDSEMDATYDQGTVGVGMHCPADPDGTTVSHNLTLHYYPNQTLVAVINNTFTTTGPEDVEIEFTTTPYYSPDTLYTLRCVSTDGDDNVATKWLISYFALDADGNRGWVKDSMLLFWGMNDIPTLYTEVNNNSIISYDGGSDIYTMHVPFFKSKGNDTFNFNETVHLESLNNEDVAFFRFMGRTYFDNANIAGWNTTTDTAAPITDEYRAYVYSLTMTCGNITNSNFSYLGSDFYRQEGLNFVGNSYEYLIHNSVFSHNAEGPIFEGCSNFTISNCTISDNVNVGLGIYFSDDFIIENNSIGFNGGRGIVMYEANNNIISYNDITNSGIHGVHYWSNSQNNTCTGNDISGSALYDYYLSSSSLGNYIIDPTSITDRIRVTSTSSVNIENTDNAAFTEDSLNTSYAYLTNFSMYVSGVSQTFDITQRNMTILPSTDKVTIWNFEWGPTIVFDITSETEINPTWFNITNDAWLNKDVYIYRNDDDYATELATESGKITFNYSENLINIRFRFTTETPAWDTLINSIAWAISIAQFLVANIGTVIVTAFSLTCILIIMILIGMALSVTNIIYR